MCPDRNNLKRAKCFKLWSKKANCLDCAVFLKEGINTSKQYVMR
jgi:hypothetical protein